VNKKRFSVVQITAVLRQGAKRASRSAISVAKLESPSRNSTFGRRRGGMLPHEARALKQLRGENARLKRVLADLALDKVMLQDVVQRKF